MITDDPTGGVDPSRRRHLWIAEVASRLVDDEPIRSALATRGLTSSISNTPYRFTFIRAIRSLLRTDLAL